MLWYMFQGAGVDLGMPGAVTYRLSTPSHLSGMCTMREEYHVKLLVAGLRANFSFLNPNLVVYFEGDLAFNAADDESVGY